VEWVEVTGRTIEEAKDAALDQLGVDESEAEFEVLEEPKAGLFGRLRAEARVRARVAPTAVRPKVDRRERRKRRDRPSDGAAPVPVAAEATAAPPPVAAPGRRSEPRGGRRGGGGESRRSSTTEAEGDTMQGAGPPGADAVEMGEEFVTGLVGAFGLECQVSANDLDGDMVEIAVEGDDVGLLIGPKGHTLAAIQELTRTVVSRKSGDAHPRLVVDVAGYRKARREALERFTRDVAGQVVASGVARVLEPMPPPDRKVVHDTANTIAGVATTSEGEDPRRRVVISPAPAEG
jgi:spoIIIJ-associated protein